MAIKKNYINAELDWAEEQLEHWKTYVEDNPIHTLTDRTTWKEIKGKDVQTIVATLETQGKFIQETMKNYLSLLGEVNKMRLVEEQKKEARGRTIVPHRMQ